MTTASVPAASSFPRSIGAVLAGLATIFATSSATDAVLHAAGVFPPIGAPPMAGGLFALALAYRCVFGVLGCWVTARLSPARPMRDVFVLGAIGFLLSVAGAIAMWDAGPAWYSIAVAASVAPCSALGGRLGSRR